jgi:hypothetical protein
MVLVGRTERADREGDVAAVEAGFRKERSVFVRNEDIGDDWVKSIIVVILGDFTD